MTDTREVVAGGSITSWGSQPMNGSTPSVPMARSSNALEFELMRGKIVTDRNTFASNVDGVFAVGDYVTGPATIIEAAGLAGAARAVDRWLSGVRGEELAEPGHQPGDGHPGARPRHAPLLRGYSAPAHPDGPARDAARLHRPGRDRLRHRGAISEGARCSSATTTSTSTDPAVSCAGSAPTSAPRA